MDEIIAYCGLICTDCPAYIATQVNDRTALERVAAQWQENYSAPDIIVESIICDGCLGNDGRHCSHCVDCEIRTCGVAQGIANCAHCSDYACEELESFLSFVPEARATLDSIHAELMM